MEVQSGGVVGVSETALVTQTGSVLSLANFLREGNGSAPPAGLLSDSAPIGAITTLDVKRRNRRATTVGRMFIIGTGKHVEPGPLRYWYSGSSAQS